MAEPVLLGQSGSGKTSATEETAATEELSAKTAFLVYALDSGEIVMNPNINVPLAVERVPHINEIYAACAVIMKDIENQETAVLAANHTVNAQMEVGRRIAEQQQSAALMGKLKM